MAGITFTQAMQTLSHSLQAKQKEAEDSGNIELADKLHNCVEATNAATVAATMPELQQVANVAARDAVAHMDGNDKDKAKFEKMLQPLFVGQLASMLGIAAM